MLQCLKTLYWEYFLVVQWLGLLLSLLKVQVPFSMGELRSREPSGMVKKKKSCTERKGQKLG